MKIKRFVASDMRQAIRNVSKDLGPEAVIISNAKTAEGIEIVAAVDYDETLFRVSIVSPAADSSPEDESTDQEISIASPAQAPAVSATDKPAELKTAEVKSGLKPAVAASAPNAPASRIPATSKPNLPVTSPTRRANSGVITPVALKDLQSELGVLRNMMESQLEGLAFGEMARRHPLRSKLIRYLVSYGFDADICRREADKIDDSLSFVKAWRAILLNIGKALPLVQADIMEKGGIISLVGPTGVGKTTTIAKLAANYSLKFGSKNIALITTDNYRIGAHEQLRTYARILGIAVYGTKHAGALADTINMLHDKKLILVDTAGISQRDERLHQQLEMIQKAMPESVNYLVLSAATQARSYAQIVKAYQSIPLAGCIFTKLDECVNLGGALSAAIKFKLPIAYVSNGQKVPEDMHQATATSLIKQAITMAQRTPGSTGDEVLEKVKTGNMVNANV